MKTVVEHLSELIRIPSPSAVSNRRLVDYATDSLRSIGWSARELPYRDVAGVEKVNLIAAPPGQDVEVRDVDLVFMCHTDTVPFASDWADALKPIFDAGLLHGCGACDVKGFLASLLTAAAQSTAFLESLRIVLSAEEEIGCIGAARLFDQGLLRPRRMVIGEPTSLHPARAGKGYCLAEVTVFGKEAHSAHPGQGVSA
ncbi:MAG: M20/M25/M40 family metallo-hydrolase, partial [Acidobacteriaceae bacterium]